jgi:chromosomal replication initiation ATPase DnaA
VYVLIGKGKSTTKKLITMCKSEIFAEILNLVGKETEVSTELILSSSKVTEVVDARSIVVFFLTEFGLYPEQIATLLHKTSASVRYLISTFESRKTTNKMIAIYLQNIRKSLENEL